MEEGKRLHRIVVEMMVINLYTVSSDVAVVVQTGENIPSTHAESV